MEGSHWKSKGQRLIMLKTRVTIYLKNGQEISYSNSYTPEENIEEFKRVLKNNFFVNHVDEVRQIFISENICMINVRPLEEEKIGGGV